jgi:hypothetical protein
LETFPTRTAGGAPQQSGQGIGNRQLRRRRPRRRRQRIRGADPQGRPSALRAGTLHTSQKGNSGPCRLTSCDPLSPSRWVSPVVCHRRRARCSPQIAAVGLCATHGQTGVLSSKSTHSGVPGHDSSSSLRARQATPVEAVRKRSVSGRFHPSRVRHLRRVASGPGIPATCRARPWAARSCKEPPHRVAPVGGRHRGGTPRCSLTVGHRSSPR